MDPPEDTLTPEGALARIAGVARKQASLRSRLEGITWVLWGLVAALQAMTLGALGEARLDAGLASRHFALLAAHLWILVGILASVGVWRASAAELDPSVGSARHRALALFVGFPLLFAAAAYLVADLGGGAFRFALVTGILLLAFAIADPVRYTSRGRWTAGALALTAFVVAGVAWAFASPGLAGYAATGALVGLSWIVAGLLALFRG